MSCMDIESLHKLVKAQLSTKRYEHTIRVMETAIDLAKRYDANEKDVTIAALFHDYAKEMSQEKLKSFIKQYNLEADLLQYHVELWHGPVAAKMLQETFHIDHEGVSNAIYYHTTGRANMSKLELIIFVADYIEPGRDFPGVERVRKEAEQSLTLAARSALKNTIMFLLKQEATIYPDTFLAYNDLTKKLGVNEV